MIIILLGGLRFFIFASVEPYFKWQYSTHLEEHISLVISSFFINSIISGPRPMLFFFLKQPNVLFLIDPFFFVVV